MKNNCLIFTIAALLIGCSSSHDKKNDLSIHSLAIPIIDLDEGLENISKTSFKCSEFIEDIQFVKLESRKESLFGFGNFEFLNSLLTSPGYVYCQMMKFNINDGKYIQQFGKQGRGPGEYIMHLSSTIDPANNRIFVLDNYGDQIVIYDSINIFIKKLNVPDAVQSIKYLGDDKLVLFRSYAWFSSDFEPFEYLIYDVNMEQILYTRKINVIEDDMKKGKQKADYYGFPHLYHWYFNNKVQLYEGFTDTIYTINPDGTRIPRLYIKREKYKPSVSEMLDNESFNKNRSKYIQVGSIFETPGFLFMRITKGMSVEQISRGSRPDLYCARYNKLTGELTIIPLINAFENDVAFFQFTSLQNIPESTDGIEYLRIPVDKTKFMLEMEQHRQNNWTESAEKLYTLIQNANPEDNGIICIYKLKNN